MSDDQAREAKQRQQRDELDQLRSERVARGQLRNAHLETGREQARSDNALVREGTRSTPLPGEDTSDNDYETEREIEKEAGRATMKAEARSRYEGSDDAFEQDWPKIREQMVAEKMENDLKHIRRRL